MFRLEQLERRDTPAYTSSLALGVATMTGNGTGDTLIVSVSGGNLIHNRFTAGDAGFASSFDWNTTVAGDQKLAANAGNGVSIDMGGGDDTLQLGTAASPARDLLAHITITAGGAGNDNLIVDNSASAVADTYDYTSTQTDATGLNFTNLAVFENGQLYKCGTGADAFIVRSTGPNNLTIEGTDGIDIVTVGSAGSMGNIVAKVTVSNTGSLSKLTLDDSADTTGDTVSISTSGAQTTIAGLSTGSVVYDHADVSTLTVRAGTGDDAFNFTSTDTVLTATLDGGPGKDSFTVSTAGGNGTTVNLAGGTDNDTFAITATPAGAFTVSVAGGGGTDALEVVSPAAGNPTISHTNATNGTVLLSAAAALIPFGTVESVSLTGTPATVTVNLPLAPQTDIVVGDDGQGDDPIQDAGFSLIRGTTFTPTEFANPTTFLHVILGNGGTGVVAEAMDAGFAAALGTQFTGGTGADTFVIRAGATLPITVLGGAGTDTLNPGAVFPGATAAPPTGILGSGPGAIIFDQIEALNLTWDDAQFAAGADRGGAPLARFFNPDGTERFNLTAFDAAFTGGVRVASADFTGDNIADLVVGTGPGGPTRVRVFDGVTKVELFTVDPFEAAFTGGVYVAAGDINGDGTPELVITPDEGGGPRVKVLSGAGFGQIADFFGIDDPNFRGGARAAVGDIDGDGFGELIVAAGFGGGPRVAAFKGASLTPTGGPKLFGDFFVFEQGLRNGAFISAGDINGDGKADLIGGGGPGGGPRVLILSGVDLVASKGDQSTVLANFFAGDVNSRGGIRVAARHLDSDAKADLVVGAGTGSGSRVTGYLGKNVTASGTPAEALAFDAYAGFAGGVFVG